MRVLDFLGAGVLLAWVALPVLARVARPRPDRDPASAYRNLLLALLLSTACVGLPWIRAWLPSLTDRLSPVRLSVHVMAITPGTERPAMARGFAVSPFGLVAVGWLAAFALACARLGVARWRLGRLLARCAAAPIRLAQAAQAEAKLLGTRRPSLLLSPDAEAPFTVGVVRPAIVLPVALVEDLEPEQLDLVLRHELAHLRRRDPLTNALARACGALFMFHPAIHSLLRELAVAREASVDAEVARGAPHAYATLLVEMASRVRFGKEHAHVSMDDTALARRIAMLIDRTNKPKSSAAALLLAAAAIATVGLLAPHVFADEPRDRFFFGRPGDGGMPDPAAAHEAEIRACYDQARQETPDLVVDTLAELSLDAAWKVTSASVPTPASPTFQRCVEQKALGWTFPPPPDLPPPPKDMPADAKRMVAFPIHLRP